MKKLLLILLCLNMLFSCKNQNNNFSNNEWGYLKYDADDKIEIEIMFNNDSVGDYSLEHINDSMISFNYKKSLKDSLGLIIETVHKDTLIYDFKYIFNRPLLITKNNSTSYVSFYHNVNRNASIHPTNNFFKSIDFKIGGFMIGDTIYKENLINIKEQEEYYLHELEANPKNNKNINFKIINNTIYEIEQKMIAEDKINNIVKVISNKSGLVPDSIKPSPPLYEEGFIWKDRTIDIRLSKKDLVQYYRDRLNEVNTKERFAYIDLNVYNNLISESKLTNDYWNLEYSHFYSKIIWECDLIENKANFKSSIIE